MKIALVAAGALPIPPKDWGAVEGTLWYRKLHLERLGHTVDIYNQRMLHDVVHQLNSKGYDFIHCHCELFARFFTAHLRMPYANTSHFGGLHQFIPGESRYPSFEYLFRDTLEAPANIVLSPRIRDLYQRSGYTQFLRVLRNAVETEQFRVAPQGNGRAICVGRICERKRQHWIAQTLRGRVDIDFVGPWNKADEFTENETAHYIGVWTKDVLYQRLTDYSVLVLLSDSEAAPKVVLEALAAGVSVVVSEACTANLTDEAFITVLPNEEERPEVIAQAVQTAIDKNALLRKDIRRYAVERFDYEAAVRDYLQIIDEFREYFSSPRS
jgi:glycosyltransferase involved in cell wall biosynthesis